MSSEREEFGEHYLDCACEKCKKLYICYSCGIFHPKVEANGIWYCPNALCSGSGGSWFRHTLKSFLEIDQWSHSVDLKEWKRKGSLYNKKNNIKLNN